MDLPSCTLFKSKVASRFLRECFDHFALSLQAGPGVDEGVGSSWKEIGIRPKTFTLCFPDLGLGITQYHNPFHFGHYTYTLL